MSDLIKRVCSICEKPHVHQYSPSGVCQDCFTQWDNDGRPKRLENGKAMPCLLKDAIGTMRDGLINPQPVNFEVMPIPSNPLFGRPVPICACCRGSLGGSNLMALPLPEWERADCARWQLNFKPVIQVCRSCYMSKVFPAIQAAVQGEQAPPLKYIRQDVQPIGHHRQRALAIGAEVEKLQPRPGDVLVLRMDHEPSQAEIAATSEALQSIASHAAGVWHWIMLSPGRTAELSAEVRKARESERAEFVAMLETEADGAKAAGQVEACMSLRAMADCVRQWGRDPLPPFEVSYTMAKVSCVKCRQRPCRGEAPDEHLCEPCHQALDQKVRAVMSQVENLTEAEACPMCQQTDQCQHGEFPCPSCGLPTTHDDDCTCSTCLEVALGPCHAPEAPEAEHPIREKESWRDRAPLL